MAGAYRRLMTLPYMILVAVFVIVPIFIVIFYSLCVEVNGQLVFSLDNYARAFEPVYLNILQRSVVLSLSCTAICILLGYPIAYILASKEYVNKGFLLFMFLVPMWMNFLLRTYSWISILERNGFVNTLLELIGLSKINLLYTSSAVLLGMIYNFLPFMILPIYSVMKKRDQSLIDAAQDLGANSRAVFFRVTLPLSLPGVVSGIIMVFMPATSTFIIADLLGGAQHMQIGNLIEQQFMKVSNPYFGSAVSVILMALLLLSFGVLSMVDKGDGEGVLF